MRPATVTLTLTEDDARWIEEVLTGKVPYTYDWATSRRILDEIKHALAECKCSDQK